MVTVAELLKVPALEESVSADEDTAAAEDGPSADEDTVEDAAPALEDTPLVTDGPELEGLLDVPLLLEVASDDDAATMPASTVGSLPGVVPAQADGNNGQATDGRMDGLMRGTLPPGRGRVR